MDLYPTLANIGGATLPSDRIIDGYDITDLLLSKTDKSPRDIVYYYMTDKLAAVRVGNYKLFVSRPTEKVLKPIPGNKVVYELYNLSGDIGETKNIYDEHPDIVAQIMKKVEKCWEDMGDAVTGVKGKNVRPIGRIPNPKPLTQYDEKHPYIIAMYDRNEIG